MKPDVPESAEGRILTRRSNMMSAFASGEFFTSQPSAAAGGGGHARWNSGEHVVIPGRELKFGDGDEDISTYQFHFDRPGQNGLALTYGQMVALSGDFYADYRRPISNQVDKAAREAVAWANLALLVGYQPSFDEANKILSIMAEEKAYFEQCARRGIPPSRSVDLVDEDHFDAQYNEATGGWGGTGWYANAGRYLRLASTNWDHFNDNAWTAYLTYHELAMERAYRAGSRQLLEDAYVLNAFGDHYLTDMFSSGHIRTPRREMYSHAHDGHDAGKAPHLDEYSVTNTTLNLSGVLTKQMHDEDNWNGLWVYNERGDVWLAYGDVRYRDLQNYANALLAQRVVALSIQQIWDTYMHRQIQDSNIIRQYIPQLIDRTGYPEINYAAMYQAAISSGHETAKRRHDLSDLLNYQWDWNYSIASSYEQGETLRRGPSLFPTGGEARQGIPPASGEMLVTGQDLQVTEAVIDRIPGIVGRSPPVGTPLSVPTSSLGTWLEMGAAPPLVAAAASSSNHAAVATWGSGAKLGWTTWQPSAWGEWSLTLSGMIYSAPALVAAGSTYYVMFVDREGKVQFADLQNTTEAVVGPHGIVQTVIRTTSLGKGASGEGFLSAPAAVASGGEIDVFAVDTVGRVQTNRRSTGGSWSGWGRLPNPSTPIFGALSAVVSPGDDLHVCALDEGGRLAWTSASRQGSWAGWRVVDDGDLEPGVAAGARRINSRASLIVRSQNDVYAFARSWAEGHEAIWMRHWNGRSWSDRQTIDSRLFISPPAAAEIDSQHIGVFAVSWDNRVYWASYDGSRWAGSGDHWTALPRVSAISQVTVVPLANRQLMLLVVEQSFRLASITLTFDSHGGLSSASESAWTIFGDETAV